MRNGFFGAIVALAAGAGLAWGQSPPGPLQGQMSGGPIIAPQLPGGTGGPAPADPSGRVSYPPPANWEGFDPNGSPGSQQPSAPLFWLNGEYLLWYTKSSGANVPLATQSGIVDNGIIGNPTTFSTFSAAAPNKFDGFRISGGTFFARDVLGVEFSGFFLNRTNNFDAISAGSPLIAVPFVNSLTGLNNSLVVGSPAVGSGEIRASSSTDIYGADGGMVLNLFRSGADQDIGYSLNLYAGFRSFNLEDRIALGTQISPPDGTTLFLDKQAFLANTSAVTQISRAFTNLPGSVVQTNATQITLVQKTVDEFQTSNHFYGGDLGLYQEFRFGKIVLGLKGRVAIGAMDQSVNISGQSQMLATNATLFATRVVGPPDLLTLRSLLGTTTNTVNGGLFAQQGNIGHYRRNVLAVIPELNASLGYQFTPSLSGFVGYNFTWVSRVVRAGDLITNASNPNLQPTSPTFANAPAAGIPFNAFKESTFWLQGLNVGMSIRY